MPAISQFLDRSCEWLKADGADSDIIVSSRARLARNVDGWTFSHRSSPEEMEILKEKIRDRIENLQSLEGPTFFNLNDISELETDFLVERHLISRELAEADWSRGVAVSADERVSIMVNEEDHLRIQAIRSGFNLDDTWEELDSIDTELESYLKYAFSPKYGYLTACPTNAGTALRVSVMLHLPILDLTNQMDNVFQSLSNVNFTTRGLYGEGTQASGDLYQISNQVTMNKTEEEFIDQMKEMVPEIVKFEREWRERMLNEKTVELKDRVFRAVGTLKHAHSISLTETAECLSALRLGVSIELLDDIPMHEINKMFLFSQPVHLQKKLDLELNEDQRNQRRANYLRESLEEFI